MPNLPNRNNRRKGKEHSETLIIPHITKEMLEKARSMAEQGASRAEIEQALLGEQLVNYFELSAGLADLEENGLATVDEAGGYSITPKGLAVADELSIDLLPRTVREAAVRAAVRAQQWARKASQHKAEVEKTGDGYVVRCSISEMGSRLFGLEVLLPDAMTAEMAKNAFIEHGSDIYAQVLGALATPGEND